MARKSYPKCTKCKKWTVGGANYCHHCGHYLKSGPNTFNNSVPIAPRPTTPRQPGSNNHKVILAEGGLITILAMSEVYALANDSYTVAIGLSIPLVAYTIPKLAPVIGGLAVDIKTVFYTPAPKPTAQTIQVEHVDEHGRPRIIADLDNRIQPEQLAWIGQKIISGASFSRPALCEPGRLSQSQYHIIKSDFQRLNYVIAVDKRAPNLGVILTERGKRLVKRMAVEYV